MQELKFKKARWRNFMSFGNSWSEIDFTDGQAVFISGENHDTGSKNGCGKTTILNVIVYALYDKPFDNISLPRLINSTNAAKNTLMEVEFSWLQGTDEYMVHRRRGESHGVTFYMNELDITPDSVNETDNQIVQTLGLSYEIFTRTIAFSGSTPPFLDLPVSQQRNYIEELFNISILSEKAAKLKRLINDTEADIKVEQAIIKEKETAAKVQEKQLADMQQKVVAWEQQNEANIVRLKKRIEQIANIDFEHEEQLIVEVTETKSDINNINNLLASEDRAISRAKTALAQKKLEHEHLEHNNCPYCLQLMPNSTEKATVVLKQLNDIHEEVDLRTINQKNYASMFDELNSKLSKISNPKFNTIQDLMKAKSDAAIIHHQLDQLTSAINPHFETFEMFESEVKIVPDYSRLDKLKSRLEHQQFLLKLLTDKNSFIRRKIISRTIPFLNLQLNYYSAQLGLPHLVKFMDDMNCEVSEFNRVLDFGNLSSGEKKRVNLAMSLAFRDVLHHLHAKVNMLFVDEIDQSLCQLGVEGVISLLKKKTHEDKLATLVVMHREGVSHRFHKELIIHKNNGFSEMEWKIAGM